MLLLMSINRIYIILPNLRIPMLKEKTNYYNNRKTCKDLRYHKHEHIYLKQTNKLNFKSFTLLSSGFSEFKYR